LTKYSAWLVIFGSALWGTDALFRRPLTGFLSPVTIVFLEHCVLSLVMLPDICSRRREFLRLRSSDYASLLFIALGGSVAATSLFTFAIKYGNPSVVILLQKTQPLFTVLLARSFLRERPSRWFLPCFVSAIAGACMMSAAVWGGGLPLQPGHLAIVLSAIGAAGLWGGATVCGRYLVPKVSIPFLTGLRFLFALPALAVLYALQPDFQRQLPVGYASVCSIVGMALIPGLAALLIYYKGLHSTTASIASICELSFPVTAVVLNWLVLDVRLSGLQLAGSVILIASVTALACAHGREQNPASETGAKLIRS
jgi:drug/metabolite transporter (DMT)-like permease